jgi:hypothetical protein
MWLDIAPKQRPGNCYLGCNTESLMEWERYASQRVDRYVSQSAGRLARQAVIHSAI